MRDGVTSIRDSHYKHFDDGRTWQRHGGYTNRPSAATQKYGKSLYGIDSENELSPLTEGELVLLNGATLSNVTYYHLVQNNKTKKKTRRRTNVTRVHNAISGSYEAVFTFNLPNGGTIMGEIDGLYSLHQIIKEFNLNENIEANPIIRAQGKLGKDKVIELAYVRPAYIK